MGHKTTRTTSPLALAAGLFALVLFPGLLFAALSMPNWFWNQTAEGFLGPNLVVNKTLTSGYRVWCWKSGVNGEYVGVAINSNLRIGEVAQQDLLYVRPSHCKLLAGIPLG